MIKAAQERRYDGRVIDTELRNPDFVAYGKAFGAHAERLAGPDELPGALQAGQAPQRAQPVSCWTSSWRRPSTEDFQGLQVD